MRLKNEAWPVFKGHYIHNDVGRGLVYLWLLVLKRHGGVILTKEVSWNFLYVITMEALL